MVAEDPRVLGGGRAPRAAIWNDRDFRAAVYQVLLILGIGLIAWYLVHNTLANLAARRIATGFDFLGREAGFDIGESLIPYSPASTYLRALVVGLLNTLEVAIIGVVLATIWG